MKYEVSRTINATPEAVWAVLSDGDSYLEWDPNLLKFEGTIAEGATISLVTKMSPNRPFRLKVESLDGPRQMVWAAGMPLGLFKGVRTFTLTANDAGGTEFHMAEEFSGLLLPLMKKVIPDLSESFVLFADGLEARAESA